MLLQLSPNLAEQQVVVTYGAAYCATVRYLPAAAISAVQAAAVAAAVEASFALDLLPLPQQLLMASAACQLHLRELLVPPLLLQRHLAVELLPCVHPVLLQLPSPLLELCCVPAGTQAR